MPVIKFRVYGKENGIMYDWDELLNMDSFNDHMRFAAAEDRYYSPLMQYTGLNDRNGKEIYEGDIVTGGRLRCQDGTSIETDRVAVMFLDGMFKAGSISLVSIHKQTEVIGNIYEG